MEIMSEEEEVDALVDPPRQLDFDEESNYSSNSGDERYNRGTMLSQFEQDVYDVGKTFGSSITDLAESFEAEYDDLPLDFFYYGRRSGLRGFEMQINDATRAVKLFKRRFGKNIDYPNSYTYRDAVTQNLISKYYAQTVFARRPWPIPYVRNPRTLGTIRRRRILNFPDKEGELTPYKCLITVTRSRPNFYIYCSNMDINWCDVDLSTRVIANPVYSGVIAGFLLKAFLKSNLSILELATFDGAATYTASFWFQVTVVKPFNVEARELDRVTFTTPILAVPISREDGRYWITVAALFLASFMSWKLQTTQHQEYFQMIDDNTEGAGHVTNIKLFFIRRPLNGAEMKMQVDMEEQANAEESVSENSSGGCRGFFGNKYISHRLTRYVFDPQSIYNNCLFFCIYQALERVLSDEEALIDRSLLNIQNGAKVMVSDLDAICEHFKIGICLYVIHTHASKQKMFDVYGFYGQPQAQQLYILLKSNHYCLITNVVKLLQFRSCACCFDWFNATTKRGLSHFSKCAKCNICGLKKTKGHNCRETTGKRKKVSYAQKKKNKFEGIENFYAADFETFQINGEMKVYAAGIVKITHAKGSPDTAKVQIFYGRNSLAAFCNFLVALNKKITVVFYNGARFDFWFILRWLLRRKIKVDRFIREPKSNKLMCLEFGKVKFWDLCLFTMASLKQLCINFNIPKKFQKGDFNHKKIVDWATVKLHRKEVTAYLYYDVMALALCHITFVEKFWDLYNMSPTKCITLSHAAYDVWRNQYIEKENLSYIKIPSFDEWKFLRRGLFGGRTMAYRKGFQSNVYLHYGFFSRMSADAQTQLFNICSDYLDYFDVVSLYPWVSKRKMPIGTPKFMISENNLLQAYAVLTKLCKTEKDEDLIRRSYFEVDVVCPDDIYIAFLFARGSDGSLIADLNPKFNQVYDGSSLIEAFILGYRITKVHGWLLYPRSGVVLDSYMSHCYKNKAKHSKIEAEYYIHKQMMNDLTGKFSQSPIECDQYFFHDDSFLTNNELGEIKRVEWMNDDNGEQLAFYVEAEKEEKTITKPSNLGVFILSESRVLMSEYTRAFDGYRNAKNCPYYCDTDSLIISHEVYEEFKSKPIFGKEWGQLKNELGEHCKIVSAFFPAPKTYALEYWYLEQEGLDKGKICCKWYIRAKGIPKGDVACTDAKDYEALEATLKEKPDDLKEALFSLHTRAGFRKETRNTLSFYFFKEMMVNDCYIIVHYGALRKYLLDQNQLGSTVKLDLDLHRSINHSRWWDNGKRMIEGEDKWDISVPAGHCSLK
jgi:DNA polymerase type B, organellar and viral